MKKSSFSIDEYINFPLWRISLTNFSTTILFEADLLWCSISCYKSSFFDTFIFKSSRLILSFILVNTDFANISACDNWFDLSTIGARILLLFSSTQSVIFLLIYLFAGCFFFFLNFLGLLNNSSKIPSWL